MTHLLVSPLIWHTGRLDKQRYVQLMPEAQVAARPTRSRPAITPRAKVVPLTPAGAARRSPARAILATLRPKQWVKNVLVIAAAGAAGALGRDDVPVRVGLACLAFCLLASGLYAINDVRDAPEDRLHPRKRYRPVAAGELGSGAAVILGLSLIVAGIGLSGAIRPLLAV